MKLIRKDYPKVREYVKQGNRYFSVDLRRKHYVGPQAKGFNNREAALKSFEGVEESLSIDKIVTSSTVHYGGEVNKGSVNASIGKLVKENKLRKTGHGLYALPVKK
jgi:hypothetical protein